MPRARVRMSPRASPARVSAARETRAARARGARMDSAMARAARAIAARRAIVSFVWSSRVQYTIKYTHVYIAGERRPKANVRAIRSRLASSARSRSRSVARVVDASIRPGASRRRRVRTRARKTRGRARERAMTPASLRATSAATTRARATRATRPPIATRAMAITRAPASTARRGAMGGRRARDGRARWETTRAEGGGRIDDASAAVGARRRARGRRRTTTTTTTTTNAISDATEPELATTRSAFPTSSFDEEERAVDKEREEDTHSGSLAGVVALIVGSTVGAGVLALPAATAEAGILPASGALIGVWILLVCDALLLAEVNVGIMRERDEDRLTHGRGHSPVVISLSDMAERTLGHEGKVFTSALYSFMSLTVLVAYISKGAEILDGALDIGPSLAAVMFTAGLGGTICFGGSKVADKLNQMLTYGSLIAFAAFVGSGAFYADWSHANWMGSTDAVPSTIPIIFLTLVYHDLIPVVCAFLQGDMKQIRRAILIGSSIPLAMFLLWNTVALAMAGGDVTADPLSIISEDLGGSASALLSVFGVSAIGTSFIGVSLGISEYLMPFMENALSGLDEPEEEARLTRALYEAMNTYEDEKPSGLPSVSRVLTFAAFLSVPLIVAEKCPNIFLPVTNFVGAYGMTTLYGVMPPIMAYTMRQERRESRRADPFAPLALRFKTNTLLPGGRLALSALSLSAIAIALSKVYEDISVVSGSGVDGPLAVGKLTELVADVATAVPL